MSPRPTSGRSDHPTDPVRDSLSRVPGRLPLGPITGPRAAKPGRCVETATPLFRAHRCRYRCSGSDRKIARTGPTHPRGLKQGKLTGTGGREKTKTPGQGPGTDRRPRPGPRGQPRTKAEDHHRDPGTRGKCQGGPGARTSTTETGASGRGRNETGRTGTPGIRDQERRRGGGERLDKGRRTGSKGPTTETGNRENPGGAPRTRTNDRIGPGGTTTGNRSTGTNGSPGQPPKAAGRGTRQEPGPTEPHGRGACEHYTPTPGRGPPGNGQGENDTANETTHTQRPGSSRNRHPPQPTGSRRDQTRQKRTARNRDEKTKTPTRPDGEDEENRTAGPQNAEPQRRRAEKQADDKDGTDNMTHPQRAPERPGPGKRT